MAGLDCAEVSPAGVAVAARRRSTARSRSPTPRRAPRCASSPRPACAIGDCGAAPLAALRALATEPAAAALRDAVGLGASSRVLLIATEGPTDPAGYADAIA